MTHRFTAASKPAAEAIEDIPDLDGDGGSPKMPTKQLGDLSLHPGDTSISTIPDMDEIPDMEEDLEGGVDEATAAPIVPR